MIQFDKFRTKLYFKRSSLYDVIYFKRSSLYDAIQAVKSLSVEKEVFYKCTELFFFGRLGEPEHTLNGIVGDGKWKYKDEFCGKTLRSLIILTVVIWII